MDRRQPEHLTRRRALVWLAATAGAAILNGYGGGEAREALVAEHTVTASVFWVGEKPSADNGSITNEETEWDKDPMARFGGVDTPGGRDFTPKHNPFYFALPAMEFTENRPVPGAHEASPWAAEAGSLGENKSLFKGRWVRMQHGEKVAYGQWLDTGPFVEDDYDYVFGDAEPSNTEGLGAGLDVSPDTAAYLGFEGSGEVTWSFVEADQVPEGPWQRYPVIDNQTHW